MKSRLALFIGMVYLTALFTLLVPASAEGLKVGVVDIDLISGQYKDLVSSQQELQVWVQDKKAFVEAMQEFMFISSTEFQEIARIYQTRRNQWSEEQKKREQQLRSISGENEKKFIDLQAKPARTPEEQNQFNTLRDTFQARDRDLQAISRTFDEELRAKKEQMQGKLVGNVREVIKTIATQKSFSVILDKSAVFFFVAPIEDITDDVLKALNAAAAPGGGGGTP